MTPLMVSSVLRTQTDERLVALARTGHERAFEALVQRYRKPLLAYCRRLLLPEARAEDVVQQALLSAWTALSAGGEVRQARAWLYTITHNHAVNALKRSGYDYAELNDALHGADAPEDDLERRIAIRETLAAMANLPVLQREALIRTAVEGRSHEQVARDLGLSGSVVRGLVYRARVSVRAAASALMPPPLVMWAATRGHGSPLSQRVGELVAGAGGSAGLASVVIKGGAVVAAAGALATGAATIPVIGHANAQAGTALSPSGQTPPGTDGPTYRRSGSIGTSPVGWSVSDPLMAGVRAGTGEQEAAVRAHARRSDGGAMRVSGGHDSGSRSFGTSRDGGGASGDHGGGGNDKGAGSGVNDPSGSSPQTGGGSTSDGGSGTPGDRGGRDGGGHGSDSGSSGPSGGGAHGSGGGSSGPGGGGAGLSRPTSPDSHGGDHGSGGDSGSTTTSGAGPLPSPSPTRTQVFLAATGAIDTSTGSGGASGASGSDRGGGSSGGPDPSGHSGSVDQSPNGSVSASAPHGG